MGSRERDHPDFGYHELKSPDTESGSRDRQKTPGRGKPAITDIRIAHIETVIMTVDEYADAVESLAVLIARYERHHPEQPRKAA
ncbi:hypothetical protein [Actinoplanes sp. NPDC089786]|uniref:hypothetical protein n=1 Tax=Actinoplanes sp. NPDC089786 TaxID=3155185 RepID=UPI003440D476